MAYLFIIRHGQAAAGWGEDSDPGLSDLGKQQSLSAANEMDALLKRYKIDVDSISVVSSPLLRAKETSIPFCEKFEKGVTIENRVAEIPSPIKEPSKRTPWLMEVMSSEWRNLSPELNEWRDALVEYLESLTKDTVIFSHYIAINVAIGYANKTDRVISFMPDNASIHTLSNANGLAIELLGNQAKTKVN